MANSRKSVRVQLEEPPIDSDPVTRLSEMLISEGFVALEDDEWSGLGERVFRREEKILFVRGETVFILIDFPELTEKVLAQAMEGIKNLFAARTRGAKMLSVLQSNTVYVCIIARNESPHYEKVNHYVQLAGGAVLIPVVIVPEINQVVYPTEDGRMGVVGPRLEYLKFLLGERKHATNMHAQTIKTFWLSTGVVVVLLIGALASALF